MTLKFVAKLQSRGRGETVACVVLNTPLTSQAFSLAVTKTAKREETTQHKMHSTCASYNKSTAALTLFTNNVTGLWEFLCQKTPPTGVTKQ